MYASNQAGLKLFNVMSYRAHPTLWLVRRQPD